MKAAVALARVFRDLMKKHTLFGKFLLLERINVGGMAEVFIAKAFGVEGAERLLAIKRILPTMAEDEEFITMFIDEARISVQLSHANVVHIFELGKYDQTFFIAMEYVPGKDIRAILERYRRRGEKMPWAQAVYIASKMCEGLDYAHRKKDGRGVSLEIIHRDVSPQNILISYEGEVKIIDFGIAKASNRSQKTQAGILKGKFGYMSPEQVRGLPVDRRSDIFAVGVILYEMLTGERLFVGESDFSTLERVRNAEIPSIRLANPSVPPSLEAVLLRALAREPEERYAWASELRAVLNLELRATPEPFNGLQLARFMKETFAEELQRETDKLARFANVGLPDDGELGDAEATRRGATTELPIVSPGGAPHGSGAAGRGPAGRLGRLEPEVEGDEGDNAERTQIVEARGVGGRAVALPGARPPPWAPETKAPRASRGTGVRAQVIIGGDAAYSGATVVGPAPTKPATPSPVATPSKPVPEAAPPPSSGLPEPVSQPLGEVAPAQPEVSAAGDPTGTERLPAREQALAGDVGRPEEVPPTTLELPKRTRIRPAHPEEEDAELQRPTGLAMDLAAAPPTAELPAPPLSIDAQELAPPVTPSGRPEVPLVPGAAPLPARKFSEEAALLIVGGAGVLLLAIVLGVQLLRPSMVDLSVYVTPANAEILVAGQRVENRGGISLRPGIYEVQASAPGYLRQFTKVTLTARRKADAVTMNLNRDVPAALEASPGPPPPPDSPAPVPAATQEASDPPADPETVTTSPLVVPSGFTAAFETTPRGARVTLEGGGSAKSPHRFTGLELGKSYSYVVRFPGYVPARGQVTAAEPKEVPVTVNLEALPEGEHKKSQVSHGPKTISLGAGPRAKGMLACSTDPAGAEIWVDERRTNRTTPASMSNPLYLPTGTHSVVFKLNSKKSQAQTVTIDESKPAKLTNIPLQ